jgi:RNA polymerase sigma-70 factor (ECF subfamily)
MADNAEHERFTRMYRQLYPRVFGYVRNRVGAEAAVDVVGDVFLVAWRRRAVIPADGLPWLLVTARNVIRQRVRRGMREDAVTTEAARCLSHAEEGAADEVVVERLTVLRAVSALPARDRDALILTVWDGLTTRDAARVAGCSAATFAVRLHRARRRLAGLLDRLDADSGGRVAAGAGTKGGMNDDEQGGRSAAPYGQPTTVER